MQREAQPVRHEPRGLLGDANGPSNLARTDAVLCVHQQPQSGQPLVKSERRIFKDSPGLERELRGRVFTVALPRPRFSQVDNTVGFALGTYDFAIRPSKVDKKLAAAV